MHIVLFFVEPWAVKDEIFDLATNRVTRIKGGLGDFDRIFQNNPDLVIFSGFPMTEKLPQEISTLATALPATIFVVHHPSPDSRSLISLLRAGVREILTDDSAAAVKEMMQRLRDRSKVTSQPEHKVGKCIGFISAKGGDGATFVAANLAAALAKDKRHRVLAIDLSLPFGELEMYLTNAKIRNDISDIVAEVDRMDQALLHTMSFSLSDNLQLIPASSNFEKILRVNADNVMQLLKVASENYDFVLVDLGAGIDPISLRLIENLNQVILVTTMSLTSAKRATQIIGLWASLEYPDSKLSIAVNRHNGGGDIKLVEFEKTVGKSAAHVLPNAPDIVSESLRVGKSVLESAPRSAISRAIYDWAEEWLAKPSGGRSLWQRIFGKN